MIKPIVIKPYQANGYFVELDQVPTNVWPFPWNQRIISIYPE